MEDSVKKIKIIEPVTPTKNIVSILIESIYVSISIPIKSVCDSFPVESDLVSLLSLQEDLFDPPLKESPSVFSSWLS